MSVTIYYKGIEKTNWYVSLKIYAVAGNGRAFARPFYKLLP